jgi:hypothetical protein
MSVHHAWSVRPASLPHGSTLDFSTPASSTQNVWRWCDVSVCLTCLESTKQNLCIFSLYYFAPGSTYCHCIVVGPIRFSYHANGKRIRFNLFPSGPVLLQTYCCSQPQLNHCNQHCGGPNKRVSPRYVYAPISEILQEHFIYDIHNIGRDIQFLLILEIFYLRILKL